jgi:hypothetical protein
MVLMCQIQLFVDGCIEILIVRCSPFCISKIIIHSVETKMHRKCGDFYGFVKTMKTLI